LRSIQASRVFTRLRACALPFSALFALSIVDLAAGAGSPGLSIVSGNGQVTQQFFNTTLPLTVEARDANGNIVANLPLTWSVTQGQGTIVAPPARTDAQGRASAYFRGDVVPGYTFSQQTVAVASSIGSVSFVVTTNINKLPNGSIAEYPLVDLVSPAAEDRNLRGLSGTTLPNAIQIRVAAQSGVQTGVPIPNVGVRIVDAENPNADPPASCAGGLVLTDSTGLARCDLVITGAPRRYFIAAQVGEFRITPGIFLDVLPSGGCNFNVLASLQQFGIAAGVGSLNITGASGCNWTAVSNSGWITITSGANGVGSGSAIFSVQANTGASRTGSITVAGRTLTITQAGTGGGGAPGFTIVTAAGLPSAVVNSAYLTQLVASGGQTPYSWSASSSLPSALTLNPTTGLISGTPTAAGTYTIPVTVRDQGGLTQTRTFVLTVVTPGAGGGGGGQPSTTPTFINTTFPNGTVGAAYQQSLDSMSACTTPFSAPPKYALTGGALPPGLAISALAERNWVIGGTPSSPGSFNFTITITDSCGRTGTGNFSMTVGAPSGGGGGGGGGGGQTGPITSSPAALALSLPDGAAGTIEEVTLSVNGPAGTLYSASTTGGNWLGIIGFGGGALPDTLRVRAAGTGALQNGTHTGTVVINTAAGNLTVPVTLTVGTGGGGGNPVTAVLAVAPSTINFSVQVGSQPIAQDLTVSTPTGTARYAVQASTVTGGAWLSATPNGGDTPGTVTVVLNPAGLQPSLYTGALTITPVTPGGATRTIPVNLQVLAAPGVLVGPNTLSFVSERGMPAPGTQILNITSTGAPFGSTISATTTSGGNWLFVTPAQGSTPVAANISVNAGGLTAGSYHGSVLITPTTPGMSVVSVPVTLTVVQAGPNIAAISNAASFLPGPVAPGQLVTIFGSEMGPAGLAMSGMNEFGRLDSVAAETRVYFDDIPAPLIYTSANQISAIVPYGIDGRASTRVSVEYRGVRSPPIEVRVVDSSPAFFTASPSGQAAALNQDGSVNSISNGAEPGSIIVLYATGEGQTTPAGSDGRIATDVFPKPVAPVAVRINGTVAELKYAGAAPLMAAGVMQINAVIPANVPRGVSVPVILDVGTTASPAGVTIAIRP
jgi:uncharacterized protein (TIGR03437 family)